MKNNSSSLLCSLSLPRNECTLYYTKLIVPLQIQLFNQILDLEDTKVGR
jgi:hypothetical protein